MRCVLFRGKGFVGEADFMKNFKTFVTVFRIRIRIGSAYKGPLDPDPEGEKSAPKKKKN
jgi:hypothetical protein